MICTGFVLGIILTFPNIAIITELPSHSHPPQPREIGPRSMKLAPAL